MNAVTFMEFIRDRLGTTNWIVAGRTSRNLVRFGEDAVFLTQAEFRAIKDEYAAMQRGHVDAA